jgi:hypothetical protein
MAIGQLYSPAGVVIGQAAVFIAPANTILPVYSAATLNFADPFDPTPWIQTQVKASATLTAGTFTLTYTKNGTAYTTSALAYTCTAAQADTAISLALAPIGAGGVIAATDVIVTGGPVSAAATPLNIVLAEYLLGGVWTLTPTGITGGTLAVNNALWSPVGSTDAGWTLATAKTNTKIYIEEQSTPVAQTIQNQDVTIQGALAEDISRTLALAWNGLNTLTAPGVGQSGFIRTALTDTVLQYAVAMITANSLGLPRFVYAPVWTSLAAASTAFRRANAKRMYPVTFETICATTAITADDFFAAGT